MWYEVENGELIRPANIDNTSSREYIYIRKEFEIVEAVPETENNDYIPAHYKWQEMKIWKEDWEMYEKIIAHDDALNDIYNALIELAQLFSEQDNTITELVEIVRKGEK